VSSRIPPIAALAALAGLFASSCRLEPSDPAAQAASILSKRPAAFQDQLVALDALAAREALAMEGPGSPEFRPALAESLHAYASRLRPSMAAASDEGKIVLLNAFLLDSLGIAPVADSAPLAASVPSLVLNRRSGSCVGLVLIYLALGRSLDLPLFPVFLPGHLFLRHRPDGAAARNIETLRGGIARSDTFYRETFALAKRPWYALGDADPRKALAALVFNMGNAHRDRGEPATALEEYRLVEEALPGFPEALGNQGACLMLTGEPGPAKEKFMAALAGDSLAEPAWRNLEAIRRTETGP
jgi:tetratricopeptide (TPR) repeat protein